MSPKPATLTEQFEARRLRMLTNADPAPVLWLALGVLLFNLWDRWLDASVAQSTLSVRLACSVLLVGCYLLLRRPRIARRFAIWLYALSFLAGEWGISLAVLQLELGFHLGMPSVLLFPLALAFYPLATWRYLLINLIGAGGLALILWRAEVGTQPAANFFLLYALSMWSGSIALRVLRRQQLRLFQLEQRHAESARTDVLTGVANRRSLEEAGAQRVQQAQQTGQPLSLLMFDLDHFKAINDRHGHDAGDLALCHAVYRFRAALRDDDLLGRWGGEEFVGLLDQADLTAAAQIAQRCIDSLAGDVLQLANGSRLRIGVSIGVASLRPGEGFDALVRRADSALYLAKQAGRGVLRTELEFGGAETTTAPGGAAA